MEKLIESTLRDNTSRDIIFSVNGGEEVLKICEDGSFLVRGTKVKEDIKIYSAFVEFLKGAGYYV